jgi:hypothetical protein
METSSAMIKKPPLKVGRGTRDFLSSITEAAHFAKQRESYFSRRERLSPCYN